jgi:hypothetical protein
MEVLELSFNSNQKKPLPQETFIGTLERVMECGITDWMLRT